MPYNDTHLILLSPKAPFRAISEWFFVEICFHHGLPRGVLSNFREFLRAHRRPWGGVRDGLAGPVSKASVCGEAGALGGARCSCGAEGASGASVFSRLELVTREFPQRFRHVLQCRRSVASTYALGRVASNVIRRAL
jgi:hypothetical protein